MSAGSADPVCDVRDLVEQGRSWVMSLRFPPVSDTASGMPCSSTVGWCLPPGRARSTGPGLLLGPGGRPARARSNGPASSARSSSRRSTTPGRRRPDQWPDSLSPRSDLSRLPAAGEPHLGDRAAGGARSPGRGRAGSTPSGPERYISPPPASVPPGTTGLPRRRPADHRVRNHQVERLIAAGPHMQLGRAAGPPARRPGSGSAAAPVAASSYAGQCGSTGQSVRATLGDTDFHSGSVGSVGPLNCRCGQRL